MIPRDEIEQVIAAIRERAKGYRETEVWACQSDASWHADEYEEWADRLEAALRKERRDDAHQSSDDTRRVEG